MNNNDLLDAIGRADGRFKQEVMDHMNKTTNTTKGKYSKPTPARRTLRLIPAVAAIVCLLAVTAYAAVNYWGIFDFQKDSLRPFPTEAQEIVQPQNETGSIVKESDAESTELVKCRIVESVNDGRQLNLTVRMESAQTGKYVLMFQDYYPELPAGYFGADYDGTIGEYAKEHNMTLLYVSAGIKNDGTGLGTGVESIQEKPQTPEIMDFLITCDMADMGSQTEGTLVTTVLEDGKFQMEDIIRIEIPFSFDLTDENQSVTYKPVKQPSVEGLEIIDVTVNHTELRTYIEVTARMPQELLEQGIFFRFPPDSPLSSSEAGGHTEDVEPGVYKIINEVVKTDLGSSFTMELISVFGPEGKTVLDTITFEK